MGTPGQFDDAEDEGVVEAVVRTEVSELVRNQVSWVEGGDELYDDDDSDGEDFIDEYVEASKGALHASTHPNQQVWVSLISNMNSNNPFLP